MPSNQEDTVEMIRPQETAEAIVSESFVEEGVTIAALTHRGKVRRTNEDQYAIVRRTRLGEVLATSLPPGDIQVGRKFAWLFAVADGLGGHVSGEIASGTAIKTILNFANNLSSWVMRPGDGLREDFKERIELYAQAIQQELQKQAQANPALAGMATTVTAAYLYGRNALLVNLGDSRSYLIRSGGIHQLTRDHTLGRDLQEQGLSPEAVRPYRNLLTRCFNTGGEEVEMDVFHLNLEVGDRILLCSDGLTDMVKDDDILEVIQENESIKEGTEELAEVALDNGGRDNITIVLASVDSIDD